jgi:hypothetical protein
MALQPSLKSSSARLRSNRESDKPAAACKGTATTALGSDHPAKAGPDQGSPGVRAVRRRHFRNRRQAACDQRIGHHLRWPRPLSRPPAARHLLRYRQSPDISSDTLNFADIDVPPLPNQLSEEDEADIEAEAQEAPAAEAAAPEADDNPAPETEPGAGKEEQATADRIIQVTRSSSRPVPAQPGTPAGCCRTDVRPHQHGQPHGRQPDSSCCLGKTGSKSGCCKRRPGWCRQLTQRSQ